MTDFGGLATGVVSVLTTLGLGIAWLVRRRDTNKDPIPKQSAAVSLADAAVTVAQGMLNDLRSDMSAVRLEVVEVKRDAAKTKDRLTATEQTLELLDQKLQAAVHYIEDVWRRARVGAWPLPPVPTELRDLIDPDLHDWASRNPEDHTGPVPDPPP